MAKVTKTNRPPARRISKTELKRIAKAAGSHFFDRGAMRHFKSRIETDGFEAPAGTIWFLTSEQFELSGGMEPRKYTIHKVSTAQTGWRPGWMPETATKTSGSPLEFQAHATKRDALDWMHELMENATQAATLAGMVEIGGMGAHRSSSSKKPAGKKKAGKKAAPKSKKKVRAQSVGGSKPAARFRLGERVQLHPATDDWMRGDRYGEVVRQGQKGTAHVKLDKSGRTKRYREDDLESIASVFDREAAQRGAGRHGVGAAGRPPRARAPGRGAQRGGAPSRHSEYSSLPSKWHPSIAGARERAFAAYHFLRCGRSIADAMRQARYDVHADTVRSAHRGDPGRPSPPPARVDLEANDAVAAIRKMRNVGIVFKSDNDVWRTLGVHV